jgi:hypothetical protein
VSPRYHDGWLFLHGHINLSFHLIGGNTHSLTEGCTDENPWIGWLDEYPSRSIFCYGRRMVEQISLFFNILIPEFFSGYV